MSRRRHLAVLLAAVLLVAGCTGSQGATTDEATTSATISTSVSTPVPTSETPASDAPDAMDNPSDTAM